MSEPRFTEIEMKLAFQEQSIEILNQEIFIQQQHIKALQDKLNMQTQQLEQLMEQNGKDAANTIELPPHY